MICPRCKRDYKDPLPNRPKGRFYHGDDHFYKKVRRYGIQCGSCGFVAEIVAAPTGENYLKRAELPPQRSTKRKRIARHER